MHTRLGPCGVLLLAGTAFGDGAATPPAGDADLREYVRKLEARVAELEKGPASRLDEFQAKPGDALAEAVRTVSVSGYAEFLYSYNFRHGGDAPGRRGDTLGYNQLRAEGDESGFTFRNLQVAVERALSSDSPNGSVGFRVAANYGTAATAEDADPNFDGGTGGDSFAVPEANLTWRAPVGPCGHTDVTVGKFRTWFGWETFESDSNWQITRNPIAVFGTPVTHTGVRAVAPLADKVEVGLALVNGWDNVRDANDGKTVLGRVAFGSFDDFLSSTFQVLGSYGTTEPVGAPQGGKRRFVEVIWNGKLAEPTEFALDAVWGDQPGRSWHGAAAYLRHHLTDKCWISARGGWYADEALGTDGARIVDGTIALGYDLAVRLTVALEYRHDFSRSDGTYLDSSGDPADHQDTLTASFLCRF